MAKQAGPVFFTGTIDGIIFYKLGDKYYSRSKGSYKSAKHMRRNPRYKRTMQQADQFGTASKLVQEVYYRHLPKAVRKQGLFGSLTGLVNGWLQEGKKREETLELLIAHCQTIVRQTISKNTSTTSTPAAQAPVTANITETPTSQGKQERTPIQRAKQARYLSSWKVKGNGRLHVPRHERVERLNPSAKTHPLKE